MGPQLVYLLVAAFGSQVLSAAESPQSSNCSYTSPNMSLEWRFDPNTANIVFSLRARVGHDDYWTGVFFGDDKPKDAIVTYIKNGQFGELDGRITGDEIVHDPTTNVQLLKFEGTNVGDKWLSAFFTRSLVVKQGNESSLAKCTTFFFPRQALPIADGGNFIVPDASQLTSYHICDIESQCKEAPEIKEEKEQTIAFAKRQSDAASCSWSHETGNVKWQKVKKGIKFIVETEAKPGKWWSAIAAGDSMADLNMGVVFLENGQVKKAGGYMTKRYGPPQKAKNVKVSVNKKAAKAVNGVASYEFIVSENAFSQTDLNGCLTLQFALNAGKYAGNFNVQKHQNVPPSQRVCGIASCAGADDNEDEFEGSGADIDEGSGEHPTKEVHVESVLTPNNESPLNAAPENSVVEPEGSGVEEDANHIIVTEQPASRTSTVDLLSMLLNADVSSARPSISTEEEAVARVLLSSSAPLDAGEEHTDARSTTPQQVPNSSPAQPDDASVLAVNTTLPDVPEASTTTTSTTTTTATTTVIISTAPQATAMSLNPNVEARIEGTGANTKIFVHPCRPDRSDLRICEGYFADYIGKVDQWARRHGDNVHNQLWKACSLLSAVRHVPTLCCRQFQNTCQPFLQH